VRLALVRVPRPVAGAEPEAPLPAVGELAGVEVVAHAGGPLRADAALVLAAAPDRVTVGAAEVLRAFAAGGGPILGIGGGFAALCEAGLLPGRVSVAPAGTAGAPTHVRVEGRATPFTWAIPAGRVVALAAPPAAGYRAPELPALEAAGRVILRYCDAAGAPHDGRGHHAVAGVCDPSGRVVGLLSDPALENQVLASLRLGPTRRSK
jgi:phosphoribosylformylglycinamidine synthase